MNKLKVVKVTSDAIVFEDGVELSSYHDQDCCESHELTLGDLDLSDFEGLEFDLSGDGFFNRIPDYGIELIPIHGHSVKIPGHGNNNGYYSDNLNLIVCKEGKEVKSYDITECQVNNY